MITETDPRPIKELTTEKVDDHCYLWFYMPILDGNKAYLTFAKKVRCTSTGGVLPPMNNFEPLENYESLEVYAKTLGEHITHYTIVRYVSTECAEDDEATNLNHHPLAE